MVYQMVIENFTLLPSLAGGTIIGLSASLLMLFNGRIAGISGITKSLITKEHSNNEKYWRLFFLIGLIIGGLIISTTMPSMTAKFLKLHPIQMIISGLLVGIGTSLSNGCTSGHGICGLARRSPRSIVSVIIFMLSGFFTVYILFHVLELGANFK